MAIANPLPLAHPTHQDERHHSFEAAVNACVLDKAEGLGAGYDVHQLVVTVRDEVRQVYTYLASTDHIQRNLKPYCWYKRIVLAGVRYHGFPEAYVASIDGVACTTDPDLNRSREAENLLVQLEKARDLRAGPGRA